MQHGTMGQLITSVCLCVVWIEVDYSGQEQVWFYNQLKSHNTLLLFKCIPRCATQMGYMLRYTQTRHFFFLNHRLLLLYQGCCSVLGFYMVTLRCKTLQQTKYRTANCQVQLFQYRTMSVSDVSM